MHPALTLHTHPHHMVKVDRFQRSMTHFEMFTIYKSKKTNTVGLCIVYLEAICSFNKINAVYHRHVLLVFMHVAA